MAETKACATATEWNSLYKAGQPVTIQLGTGELIDTVTISDAFVTSGVHVVMTRYKRGTYALGRITPRPRE